MMVARIGTIPTTLTTAPASAKIGDDLAVGFVLISVEPSMERDVYQRLLKIEEVVELYPLFGEYDLIAKVEAETYDKIGEIVVSKVRAIEGIKATKTLAKMAF
jgi:DNA-binding Lrp family transcriptional regulator